MRARKAANGALLELVVLELLRVDAVRVHNGGVPLENAHAARAVTMQVASRMQAHVSFIID